jgi:transcriptional regulator with XRE-family HTH domain
VPSAKVLFGQEVRALREARGISQEKLAELCALNRNYINRVETGRTNPKLDSILKLASGLDVLPARLLRPFPKQKAADRA